MTMMPVFVVLDSSICELGAPVAVFSSEYQAYKYIETHIKPKKLVGDVIKFQLDQELKYVKK